MPKRTTVLPDRGVAIVNTDVHGNLEDIRAARRAFEASGPEAHWVVLGDLVHGPDDGARAEDPLMYGYPDESMRVVEEVLEARRRSPDRVHFVLGNHDHGHVGGPHTRKFHRDEVAHLEQSLSAEEKRRLEELFSNALLAVLSPCGVFFSHGSPPDDLRHIDDLERIQDLGAPGDPYLTKVLAGFLTHYGQRDDVSARFLAAVSAGGVPARVVVHGHDRDERGYFYEGQRQLCLCIFGAHRHEKRYLRLDLGGHYQQAADLRDGVEILRLHDGR